MTFDNYQSSSFLHKAHEQRDYRVVMRPTTALRNPKNGRLFGLPSHPKMVLCPDLFRAVMQASLIESGEQLALEKNDGRTAEERAAAALILIYLHVL